MIKLRQLFFDSFLYKLITQIQKNVFVRLMTEDGAFSALWFESGSYRVLTFHIKKLMPRIPRADIRYAPQVLGVFFALIFLIPTQLWHTFFLLLVLMPALLFISNGTDRRAAESLLLVAAAEGIFIALLFLMLPSAAVVSFAPLLIAIAFFFFLQYSVNNTEQLYSLLNCIMLLFVVLCCIGLVQSYRSVSTAVRATFSSSESFAEILVLFFPFAAAAAIMQKNTLRKAVYTSVVMILSFRAILATGSKAGLIGYSIEFLLMFAICNFRYLFLALFIAPAVANSAIGKIVDIWHSRPMYSNFFVTVAILAQDIWKNGFGMSSRPFLELYTNTILNNAAAPHILSVPITQGLGYLHVVLELGLVILFLFMWYVLRLAHSAVIASVTAKKALRPVFAAGLSALLGISVSALFSYSLLQPRNLLAYFSVIGILAAVKRIRLMEAE